LATFGADGRVLIGDPNSGDLHSRLSGNSGEAGLIAFQADGARLVVISRDARPSPDTVTAATLRIWNLETAEVAETQQVTMRAGWPLVFLSDGKRAELVEPDGHLRLLDSKAVQTAAALQRDPTARTIALSDDAKLIALAGPVGIAVIDAATGWTMERLGDSSAPVSFLAWLPNSRRLVSLSLDGTAKIWDVGLPAER
jgi:WD40 repeat protein